MEPPAHMKWTSLQKESGGISFGDMGKSSITLVCHSGDFFAGEAFRSQGGRFSGPDDRSQEFIR